ncbi:MAG: hypothetical protein PUK21_04630 [Peptostreptococcaceae bacterium]|nr:hypothetical protein [Peptostreptococcaceae bacterium]MDY5738804.1 hypothetical protein [Anaerovoracaceae bacterium]
MEYFLGHIGYIVIAAIVIAAVAFASVYFADRSKELNKADAETEAEKSCGAGCSSCSGCVSLMSCNKDDKKL